MDIANLTGLSLVQAGEANSCAKKASNGHIWCWGFNGTGELSNDSRINSPVPVRARGLDGSQSLALYGDSHSCAISSGGTGGCWGSQEYGQLGDGSLGYRPRVEGTVLESPSDAALRSRAYSNLEDGQVTFELDVDHFGPTIAQAVTANWSFTSAIVGTPSWRCLSSNPSMAPCPATSGSGNSAGPADLPAGQSWRLYVTVTPPVGANFVDLRAMVTSSNAGSAQSNLSGAASTDAIFRSQFE